MKGPKRHMAVAFQSISIVHSHGKCCHEDLTKIYCCTLATTKHCVSVLCYPLILTVRFFFVPHSIIYHLISFIQNISFAFVVSFNYFKLWMLPPQWRHDPAFCIESIYLLYIDPLPFHLQTQISDPFKPWILSPTVYTFVYIQHLLSHCVHSSGASLGGTSAHGEPSGITINDHHDHPGAKQIGVKVLHKKDTKQGCEIKRESSFINP